MVNNIIGEGGVCVVIQHNMSAEYSARMEKENQFRMTSLTSQLSTGNRLVYTKTDAAGATISQKMRGQIRGFGQASSNSQDGVHLLDVADGAASQIHDMLQRMRELAVQATNDTNNTEDRQNIQKEFQQLREEIDRIAEETEYNKKKLFDGTYAQSGNGLNVQVGANAQQSIEVLIDALKSERIGIETVGLENYNSASSAITSVSEATEAVSQIRGRLGAIRNRFNYAIHNTDNMAECLQHAESRIADTDMAKTMVAYAKESILKNSITAMLTQSIKFTYGIASLMQTNAQDDTKIEKKEATR